MITFFLVFIGVMGNMLFGPEVKKRPHIFVHRTHAHPQAHTKFGLGNTFHI